MLSVFMLAQAAPAAVVQQAAVVSYDEVFFAAAAPSNALDMVGRLPGFTLETGDQVRGFEGAAGNLLIDGERPVTKSENLQEILRRLPASQVERIDVIRGGAPGIDMQGKAVLANIVRKKSGGWRAAATLVGARAYDSRPFGNLRLEASGERGQRAWEAGLLVQRALDDGSGEGPHLIIGPGGEHLAASFVDQDGGNKVVNLTGAVQVPFAGGKLRLNGRASRNFYDYGERDVQTYPYAAVETAHDGDHVKTGELGARFNRDLGPRTKVEALALLTARRELITSDRDDEDGRQDFALNIRSRESIARSVLKVQQSERLFWELGGEGALNVQRSRTAYSANGVPVDLPAANTRVKETRGEIFAKAVWRASPAWTFEAGLRQEGSHIASSGDVVLAKTLYFTKPRLAATWNVSPATQLRLRYEREVGQLDFSDFAASGTFNGGVVSAGNPDIAPEKAWISEAAVEQRFLGKAVAVATFRHYELSDVVDRIPSGGFDAPGNIGKGTKDEVVLGLTLPLDRVGLRNVQLKGEATKRWSSVTDPTTGTKRQISMLYPLEWQAHLTHDLPHWKANWGVDVNGGWRRTSYRTTQVDNVKLKPYVAVFAEWKPQPDLTLRVDLLNVTKRGLRRTLYQYDGPRGGAPLLFIDDSDNQFGRMIQFKVRKSFGN